MPFTYALCFQPSQPTGMCAHYMQLHEFVEPSRELCLLESCDL